MRIIYFLAMMVSTGYLLAQTQNESFENWTTKQNQIYVSGTANIQGFNVDYEIDDPQFTYNELVDWSSLNQLTMTESIEYPNTGNPIVELVVESTDFVTGTKSVQIESAIIKIKATITIFGTQIDTSVTNVAPGILVSGVFDLDEAAFADQILNGASLNSLNPFTYEGTGQPIDFQPKKLKGSYQYTGVGGDSAMFVSGLIKDRELVAYVIKRLPNAATWTDFELEYEYLSCDMPDTIITLFCSSNLDAGFTNNVFAVNSAYTGINGSVLLVDALSLDTINPTDFPPIAYNDTSELIINDSIDLDVLLNDEICGGVMVTPVILSNGSNGTASILVTGEMRYVPDSGYTGFDTISYYICTNPTNCDTAEWYIETTTVPLCVAVDDNRSLPVNGSSVFDPMTNDGDCGGTPNIVTLPVNGVANVEVNGFISYSPLTGFIGMDSLVYSVCSTINTSQCSTAKIYYEVLSTGIIEIPAELIKISPNPAQNWVKIQMETRDETQVSIFNMLGKKISSNSFNNELQLDTKNFTSGLYLVQFENDLGQATKKLIINK